ncbi:UPF0158 family protein [Desulfobacterota bacterium AH_259_B03_O07]|nr:UPF0158 family protein [Desulfobacterota bacterium AH_259_B03_O07]
MISNQLDSEDIVKQCRLGDVVDALEMQSDMHSYYFDTNTGKVILLSEEELSAAEGDEPLENYPEWQREPILQARLVLEDTQARFLSLPTTFDIHEYSIIESFCLNHPDRDLSETLCDLIRGRGAFRRFKDAIHRHGIQEEWYAYRYDALVEIAKEWCEEHGIKYTIAQR